ncbi:GH92 family glycosyl hydrolase [Xanthocytophaga agilis]|uniref:GH92 family glycosyl hydrolase n=1 Tax=Xanthocytophaga agilis TaxID=3048010 RepID=A0AAE3UIH8_9BACT|nr:GH92 family glycosyl hydrolase [Xanthocytophaga agilis]MDJ1506610.1 GH92 family glycosyl hydrolase [Xanthocytophaga agilis]
MIHCITRKIAVLLLTLLPFLTLQAQNKFLPYVNPLTGTSGSTTLSTQKHAEGTEPLANTIPAVTLPFAMTQWTPQTQYTEKKCLPPYYYKDTMFSGIRGTHWLSGSCVQDYGTFTIMPITGHLKTTRYETSFSHQQEITTPAYYSVELPDYQIRTEVTPTKRSAIIQFTAQKDDSLYILITPNSDYNKGFIHVNASQQEVTGYNPAHRIYQGWGEPAGFSGYFAVKVEQAFSTKGTYSNTQLFSSDSLSHRPDIGAYIGFKVTKGMVIRLKVGTSFTSIEGARANLQEEITDWNFEAIRKKAEVAWEQALGKIVVETRNENDKRIFYTALYHAFQHPRLFSDADGKYPQFAGNYQIKQLAKGNYYDDFSMWDIYRAQLPLLEIIDTDLVNDLVNSLILKSQQGNWLPNFPCWNSYTSAMVGDHASAFIASAYIKGIRGYNVEEAYKAMRKNAYEIPDQVALKDGRGRRSLGSYLNHGYYPMEDTIPYAFHKNEQVSRTLEYAFDDYCVAQLAKGLQKNSDYRDLIRRSANYRNVFDPSLQLVNGRYADGSWMKNYNPDKKLLFITEGTPRQYSFYVPHDINGLIKLIGGTTKFEAALDDLFQKNEYWHGNEPGQQIPFLYIYTDAPYKTQYWVNHILKEEYANGPGGLSGNDDSGQVSAWYVLASMGLYPINPASDEYAITSPLFSKVTLHLPNQKTFSISAKRTNEKAIYVQEISLNGKLFNSYILKHNDLMQGGNMSFILTEQKH